MIGQTTDGASHMPTAAETLDKLDATRRRLDLVTSHQLEAAVRQKRDWIEEDRLRAQERSARAHADAVGIQSLQASFDPIFQPYGLTAPPAVAGESPRAYHLALLEQVQDQLSVKDGRKVRNDSGAEFEVGALSSEELPVRGMPREMLKVYEAAILNAAKLQAAKPHRSTLPRDGTIVERVVANEAGGKRKEFYGRHSFIKAMGRPARKVAAILGKGGQPIWPYISRDYLR
jgi:hypothetical protein